MCQTKLCKVWSILGEKGETSVMGQKESRNTERRGRETTLSLDVVGRWFRRVRNIRNAPNFLRLHNIHAYIIIP